MEFEQAMQAMRMGKQVQRPAWNDPKMKLEIVEPKAGEKIQVPFIHVTSKLNNRLPWTANQADLMADDWEVVEAPAAAA